MGYGIIIVSSYTYAMMAKKELSHAGIYCGVEKIKEISDLPGCGYGVTVRGADLERAARLLRASGIRVVEIIP